MAMRPTSIQTSRLRGEDGYILLKTVIAVILITICFSAILAAHSPALSSVFREVRLIDAELETRNASVREFSRGL